jgi:ferredoxin
MVTSRVGPLFVKGTLVRRLRRSTRPTTDQCGPLSHRSFPTEGYVTPGEVGEDYARRQTQLQAEILAMDQKERSRRATLADQRVLRGPTQADRDHIPYIQEAWEWACGATRSIGLKRRRSIYASVLDVLTRLRVAALIERRNLVWPETAAKVAGVDTAWIVSEHGGPVEEFERYVAKARGLLGEGLEEGWNGVVWGDIDPDDPLRFLEIDAQACRGCGQCVVLCPDIFAKSDEGDFYVSDPVAVRDRVLHECCMAALGQCPEGAILLRTRGGRTITGQFPPRGRPLPGDRTDETLN